MAQDLIYLSENELKLSKEYWKQFKSAKEKEARKRDMIDVLESGTKYGFMFEFGYPDVPKGYSVFSELPRKYQRVISAYKVLAHELSTQETKYLLYSDEFLFNKENGSIRAPIRKMSLESKLESN